MADSEPSEPLTRPATFSGVHHTTISRLVT